MSYIACPFCGGGVPGMPCRCQTSATPFDPRPPTPREAELLRRIEELEAEVARLLKGEE